MEKQPVSPTSASLTSASPTRGTTQREVKKLKLRLPRGLDLHLEFYDLLPGHHVPVATPGEIPLVVTKEPNPGFVAVINLKLPMRDVIC